MYFLSNQPTNEHIFNPNPFLTYWNIKTIDEGDRPTLVFYEEVMLLVFYFENLTGTLVFWVSLRQKKVFVAASLFPSLAYILLSCWVCVCVCVSRGSQALLSCRSVPMTLHSHLDSPDKERGRVWTNTESISGSNTLDDLHGFIVNQQINAKDEFWELCRWALSSLEGNKHQTLQTVNNESSCTH